MEEMKELKSKNAFWRQGDIYFVRLDEEVDVAKATKVKTGIIAKGEHTGHSHRLMASSMASGATLLLVGREMFLHSPSVEATIVHDEHDAIDLPAGVYAILHQREFDGLEWRRVVD
jgi:hypothetical protein